MTFSNAEKADEAEREVRYRAWVYSSLIERGKLAKGLAERRIEMMKEIASDYRAKADAEAAEGRLL